jgi:hypothetical protein
MHEHGAERAEPAPAADPYAADALPPRSALWHYARVCSGVSLCAVGVLGTLLPVIPGVPLIIAGVALLGTDHWLVRPVKQRVDRWRGL